MNVRFSSPHTLPVEKESEGFEKESEGSLQPHRITPFGAKLDEDDREEKARSAKNVINLKE
ncbi:MAG: hypothetical protein A2Z52_01140 [Candidatus Moranbacteria bacterium RBG_19FT_COMBO_42_6]|nr:MAG: hypothetical protein A2Z52_01140 [Candidatus Moranbacteria bacterium RBG_19FT_COMBO_42_6]